MLFFIREWLRRFEGRKEKGQGLLEYALIMLLIVIIVIAALSPIGDRIKAIFDEVLLEIQP